MSDESDTAEIEQPELSEPLRRALGERYLTYALSTIMHRALPDARDGLKPVHRRILYAMRELRLSSTGGYRKSAKISGDVMGNYHPHGDAAIYDAMARLAQDFNVRYPLVDGQGNFGNIDGDNPAASRYTEARMTAMAEALLVGLDEDAVDFRDNYDGTLTEPVVLPAAFPNLRVDAVTISPVQVELASGLAAERGLAMDSSQRQVPSRWRTRSVMRPADPVSLAFWRNSSASGSKPSSATIASIPWPRRCS